VNHSTRRIGTGVSAIGWVAERFKAPVLKTGVGAAHRGFESHPIRQPGFCRRSRLFLVEQNFLYFRNGLAGWCDYLVIVVH
jgi:hypothetical protein